MQAWRGSFNQFPWVYMENVWYFQLIKTTDVQAYNPFDSPIVRTLPFLPLAYVVAFSLIHTVFILGFRLPKPILSIVDVLSPFIKDDDLRNGRIGQLSSSSDFLRRGAILEIDGDPKQYSSSGLERQVRRNVVIILLALVEVSLWIGRASFHWSLDGTPQSVVVYECVSLSLAWVSASPCFIVHAEKPF